ncbi:secreted protein [Moniliophthora roreri]|nr:secreted protein [Moniliophthora roreri]
MIARLSFILAIAVALLLLPEISVGRALQARRHMKRFTPDKREPCVGLGCWYGGIGISGPEHKHKHNKHPHHDHTSTSKNSGSDQEVYLNLHNELRAQHGASQLTWNKTLEHAAQEWADRCIFEHSQGELGELGENLSAGVGKDFDAAAAVQLWIDEAGVWAWVVRLLQMRLIMYTQAITTLPTQSTLTSLKWSGKEAHVSAVPRLQIAAVSLVTNLPRSTYANTGLLGMSLVILPQTFKCDLSLSLSHVIRALVHPAWRYRMPPAISQPACDFLQHVVCVLPSIIPTQARLTRISVILVSSNMIVQILPYSTESPYS